MYKMIAIDIDGTLLNDQHELTQEVRETIYEAKAKGVKIVLCTGRPLGGVQNYLKELNLTQEGDYVITCNGAIIQNTYNDQIVSKCFLAYEDLTHLYDLSLELNTPMHFYDLDNIYTPNQTISQYTVFESHITQVPLNYCRIEEIPKDMEIPKVLFIDEPKRLKETISSLPTTLKERYTMVQSAPYFFEFLRPEVGKGPAVERLAGLLNIKQEEVICIGDNDNDMTMIEYAGCGVAMGNAIPELKEIADYQTTSNNENGVAHAIQKLVLAH